MSHKELICCLNCSETIMESEAEKNGWRIVRAGTSGNWHCPKCAPVVTPLTCVHGRLDGHLCPHCAGTNTISHENISDTAMIERLKALHDGVGGYYKGPLEWAIKRLDLPAARADAGMISMTAWELLGALVEWKEMAKETGAVESTRVGSEVKAADVKRLIDSLRARQAEPITSQLIDRIIWQVFQCADMSELWSAGRRNPEAFRRAVRRALEGL